jgi:hypothetical protein
MKPVPKPLSVFFALTLSFLSSCSDLNLDVANPNQLGSGNFYTSLTNLNLSLTSVYEGQASADLYGFRLLPQVLYALDKTSDQAFLPSGDRNQFFLNEVTPTNAEALPVVWQGLYRTIARANDFLDGSERYRTSGTVPASEETRIRQMQGEAYWLRAHMNFHLVRLWGEANFAENANAPAPPLILEVAGSREQMNAARSTVGEFYAQIINDLREAETRLPATWPATDVGRVSSFAAKALLGQVYLYQQNYPLARQKFEEVLAGPFSLVPFARYDALFRGTNEFSTESIFELNYSQQGTPNAFQGGAGHAFVTVISPKNAGFSNQYPHDENIRRFGTDPRLRIAALQPGVDKVVAPNGSTITVQKYVDDAGALGWSHRKYVAVDVPMIRNDFGSNVFIIRLADVYLMYAEALNASGNDAVALDYVNRVRRRAYGGVPTTPGPNDLIGLTGTVLRDAIREERFKELFGEGHRWYDLRRWGIIQQELARYKTTRVGPITYEPKDAYLPIPQDEIDRNPNITQSTGY